ncbi:MAG: 2-phosphosulfolactate phosphatase [Candidatus Edwardsbacteria bacterium]
MKKIDLFFTPNECEEGILNDRTVIVIDVLRAATTIAYALQNDCKEIIPLVSIEEAAKLAERIGRENALLCGEREGKKINAFDLGNSPLEFTPEVVKDKTLIMTTTNGTFALSKTKGAEKVLIGSFVNLSAIVKSIKTKEIEELTILCSGKLGRFALEDVVCAGMLLSEIKLKESNDAVKVSLLLYKQYEKDLYQVLCESKHGQYLISLGLGEDLKIASRVNSLKVVPILKEGRIIRGENA